MLSFNKIQQCALQNSAKAKRDAMVSEEAALNISKIPKQIQTTSNQYQKISKTTQHTP